MRRNQDDAGENLASRFEDTTSPAPEQSTTGVSLAPNAEERNRIVQETLFGGKKVQEIIQALDLDIDSYLGAGVIDHFENILVLLRDLKAGEVELPHVNTQGLHALVDQHPNAKLVDVMGDVMYLHKQCFVSIAYNDRGDISEDGDQVRCQVLGEQRFPFTVQTELQLFYNDDAEAIVSVQSMTSNEATKALAFFFRDNFSRRQSQEVDCKRHRIQTLHSSECSCSVFIVLMHVPAPSCLHIFNWSIVCGPILGETRNGLGSQLQET
jgi:hypothetical protein